MNFISVHCCFLDLRKYSGCPCYYEFFVNESLYKHFFGLQELGCPVRNADLYNVFNIKNYLI